MLRIDEFAAGVDAARSINRTAFQTVFRAKNARAAIHSLSSSTETNPETAPVKRQGLILMRGTR